MLFKMMLILLACRNDRKRCGTCDGCRQVQDCGMCVLCKDKPKFGGRGKRKQCCKLKVCNFIANKTVPPSESLEEAQHLEMSKKMKFDHTIDTYTCKLVVVNYIQ